MSNEKHTPLPWFQLKDNLSVVVTEDESFVAMCDPLRMPVSKLNPEDVANAAFIVRACNSHKALVDALELAEKHLTCTCADAPGMCAGNCARFQARAALKLAKGA